MKRTWTWNPAKGREALQKTLRQVGRAAADFMAERTREYAHEDTGALKASIGVVDETGGFTYQVICTVPYAVYQEFGWYDISQTWHPPVGMLRKAIADTKEQFPQIAVKFRVGGPDRHVSEAPFSQEPGPQRSPRQHTFETEREKRIETEVGSHTGK
jgi:hypothetical protein